MNIIKRIFKHGNKKEEEKSSFQEKNNIPEYFTKSLEKNKKIMQAVFNKVEDVKFRDIYLSGEHNQQINIQLIYVENIVSTKVINEDIIKQLMTFQNDDHKGLSKKERLSFLANKIINVKDYTETKETQKAINEILKGKTILLVDGIDKVLSLDTQGRNERAVTNPNVEITVRGPQEAFMENVQVNLGLLRRRIVSKDLKVINFVKGKHSQTSIIVVYLDGVANEKIVQEVISRIERINVAQINGCSQVAELIEDNPLSLFNTIYDTERPDVAAAGILEGRVGVFTDGCPTGLLAPKLFVENFISPEDYYYRFWITFALRILRFMAYFVSTFLPSIYVAVLSFHQELIPTTLARTIYAAREGVPFPIFIEMLIFLLFFQIIKESGATVPVALSTSTSIVGTLILGQTAITAGFLSADGVIIGSITGIALFLLPVIELSHALFYLRFILLFVSSFGGLLGIVIVSLLILVHMNSLRSFGVPYLSPLAPFHLQDLKDFFIRVPYIFMNTRPASLEAEDQIRQGNYPLKRYFFKYKIKPFANVDEEEQNED